MSYPLDDTIVALASAPGGAARAIVRLSGPGVAACLASVVRSAAPVDWAALGRPGVIAGHCCLALGPPQPSARDVPLRPLPAEVLFWPEGRSYTGQTMAEIHTFGSPPLVDALVGALCGAGARLARPGEFSLRAVLAGRMDLTEAEAVLGVIEADDPRALDVALRQLAGGLADPLRAVRAQLADALARVEASLDFADEDIPPLDRQELHGEIAAAAAVVADLAGRLASRGLSGETARVALVGAPNTGKSSLFNALGQTPGAIVSDHAGTTRDYLTAELRLGTLRCTLIDTPGGFSGGESGEAAPPDDLADLARASADQQAARAHVRLWCVDSTRPLTPWEREQLRRDDPDRWIVLTKCDAACATDYRGPAVATSSLTGEGLDALRRAVERRLVACERSGDAVPQTARRCRPALSAAGEALRRAAALCDARAGDELVAAELRAALSALGEVVGAVATDELLDRIFSRFCIGK